MTEPVSKESVTEGVKEPTDFTGNLSKGQIIAGVVVGVLVIGGLAERREEPGKDEDCVSAYCPQ